MQEQFVDRILTCVDCHGEFIFTAGEQLFFFDKQFKNDPKRCKPCKSRRSGLSAAANGTSGPIPAGLSRTETRTQCSDCGIETTVPFKPTQGRPVLCRQCFQIKNRAAVPGSTPAPVPTVTPLMAADASLAAATLASMPQASSVATPAELAYVAGLEPGVANQQLTGLLTVQLIASSPAELLAATPQSSEMQSAAAEA
jgi:CxxC-x17-CxxC domain-containing protein